MLAVLDADAIRRWCTAAAQAIQDRRGEIDDLNVYPIPDGDTGTNLQLTLRAAADAVAAEFVAAESASAEPVAAEPAVTAGQLLRAMARGAVLGARGNSGVILSQILTGLAEGCGSRPELTAQDLTAGLRRGTDAAYRAVAEPAEGTILTVLRCATEVAEAQPSASLAALLTAVVGSAERALAATREQLPALAEAGVIDAGGLGLVVVLDELAAIVTGERAAVADFAPAGRSRGPLLRARESGSGEFGYEVQYLLEAPADRIAGLRGRLTGLGDSLVVAGTGDGHFNVHVHVNDVGAAIEAGIEVGRPYRIGVVRFDDQLAAARPSSGQELTGVALVAVAPGEGLAELFRGENVAVVDGGPTDNPSTEEVLSGILGTGAAQVILLPNASAVGGVAELAAAEARLRGVQVAVVPTKSPLQGLAAVAVHDEHRRFEDNVIAVAEAAAATRFAEVTVAVRDSLTYAGRCAAGDVLGLIDGEVVEIGSQVAAVGIDLVNRLVAAGGELVTVLSGADAGAAEAAAAVVAHVRGTMPFVEVRSYVGGQPHYPVLIGVE